MNDRTMSLSRRGFLGLLGAGALGAAAARTMHAAAPKPAERPNIILCMTDDQGWGDTSYNGHPELKTPNLDAMAASGIRFDRFYAANPLCSPTRASCLTGRSPLRYCCFSWGHDLPLREVTLAEAARTAGYATGHFGKWHLGGIPNAAGGTGRGLPESFCPKPRHPGNQGFDEWFSAGNWYDIGHEHIYHNGRKVSPRKGDTADVLMDVAMKWIGRQAANTYARYGGKKANYYGELAAVDRNMGRLRKALREMKIADNTMLWFCSDNGGAFPLSTGGLPGGKKWLTEGGTRVPGILEWPARVPKPFITRVPACTMDFYPTVLDLLGVKMPDQIEPIDGISLLPLIDGRMARRPKPIPLVAGRQQVRLVDNEYIFMNKKLFRFDEDKRKDVDITDKEPEAHKRLSGLLKQWQASVKKDQAAYRVKRR